MAYPFWLRSSYEISISAAGTVLIARCASFCHRFVPHDVASRCALQLVHGPPRFSHRACAHGATAAEAATKAETDAVRTRKGSDPASEQHQSQEQPRHLRSLHCFRLALDRPPCAQVTAALRCTFFSHARTTHRCSHHRSPTGGSHAHSHTPLASSSPPSVHSSSYPWLLHSSPPSDCSSASTCTRPPSASSRSTILRGIL